MSQVSKDEEGSIREACRHADREEGVTKNPYATGTTESLIWGSEETRMMIEVMESV